MPVKPLSVIILIILTVAGMTIYLLSPDSLQEIFQQPVNALLGAPHRINVTLLEVSRNPTPVQAAGRRLLQPLGMVQFIRSIPPVSSVADHRESSDKDRTPH